MRTLCTSIGTHTHTHTHTHGLDHISMHYCWNISKASSLPLHQRRFYIEAPLTAMSDRILIVTFSPVSSSSNEQGCWLRALPSNAMVRQGFRILTGMTPLAELPPGLSSSFCFTPYSPYRSDRRNKSLRSPASLDLTLFTSVKL